MTNSEPNAEHGLLDTVKDLGQKIIGEIEEIGGALTGDPLTQAEGQFNADVARLREEAEDSLNKETDGTDSPAGGKW
ncbi:MAG TPA: hypothetical protein PKA82_10870 [Pyrinomonadaceae bacterium]|nr:hypothetical protein [Pyrinomonadaceae bacterium]